MHYHHPLTVGGRLLCPPVTYRCLRHYIVGSPDDAQMVIDRLHLLGYLERINWSPEIAIPGSGLLIRPEPGDILRYCQRDRSMA